MESVMGDELAQETEGLRIKSLVNAHAQMLIALLREIADNEYSVTVISQIEDLAIPEEPENRFWERSI